MERFTAHLYMCSVTVHEDRLEIKKGFLIKDTTTLLIDTITAVSVKKPGLNRGCITFSTAAGSINVEYALAHISDARKLKDMVETDMLARQKKQATQDEAVHPVQHSTPAASIDTDKLRELKSLLDDGVISQADFDAAKQKILGL